MTIPYNVATPPIGIREQIEERRTAQRSGQIYGIVPLRTRILMVMLHLQERARIRFSLRK